MKNRIFSSLLAIVMVIMLFTAIPLSVSADAVSTPTDHYIPNGFLNESEFFLMADYYDSVNEKSIQYYIDNDFDIHLIEDGQYFNEESGEVLMPANIAKYTAEVAGRFTFYKNGGSVQTTTYKIKSSDGRYLSVNYNEETSTGSLQLTSSDEGALWYYFNYGICQIVGSNYVDATKSFNFVCNYSVYLDRSEATPKLAVDVIDGFTWSYENFDHPAISPMYRSCDHKNMEKHDAVGVTCLSDGQKEYYFCKDCENYFFDSEGRDMFWDVKQAKIIAEGHRDDDANLVCDNCEQTIAPRKFERVTDLTALNTADEYIIVDENGYVLVKRPSSEKGGKGGKEEYDFRVTPSVHLTAESDESIDYYKAKKNGAYIFKFVGAFGFEEYNAYGFYSYGTMMECMESSINFEESDTVKYGQIISFGNDGELIVYPMYCENWQTNGDYLKTAKQGEYGEVLFCDSLLGTGEEQSGYEYCKVYLYRAVADSVPEEHTHTFGDWTRKDDNTHERSCACGETETAAHTWDDGEVTTSATHTSTGVKTFTCTECGATKTETISVISEHSFGDWTKKDDNTHERSCACGETETANHNWVWVSENSEIVLYECDDCGATKTEAHVHDFIDWTKKDDEKHIRSCTCGATEEANHRWDDGNITTEPTHLTEGIKTYTCCDCGAEYTEIIGRTAAHAFGDWTRKDDDTHERSCACGETETADHVWTLKETTLTAKNYECEVCGATKTESVDHTHSFGDWKPSTTEGMTHYRECACGEVERENHVWDNGKITTPATHTEYGEKTFTCRICGGTKTEPIEKTAGHEFGDWKPSTTEGMTHYRECACGEKEIAAHRMDEGRITKPATHTEKGIKTYTCIDCGFTKTEELPILTDHVYGDWIPSEDGEHHIRYCSCQAYEIAEHTFDEGKITKPATHTEEGVKTYTCTVCGGTKTETIEKTSGHEFGEWKPSTTEGMTHYRECACGEVERGNHVWDGGKVTTAATHTEKGEKTFTCTVCGATKTEEIPTLTEHTYGDWIPSEDGEHHIRYCNCQAYEIADHTFDEGKITKPATHTEKGEKTFTCTACGATKTEEIPMLTEHTYGDWIPSEDGEHHIRYCNCQAYEIAEHTFDEGKITKPATKTEKGERTFTCTVCGGTKTEEIPMLADDDPGTTEDITVSVEGGTPLPEGTVVKSSQPDENEVKEVEKKIKDQAHVILQTAEGETPVVLEVYDISLDCNGVSVQPDGTVAVTLPAPELTSKDSKIRVIYISPTGDTEVMETVVNPDGSITFKTTHFSRYAIVEIVEDDAPAKDDGLPTGVIVAIAASAAVVVAVIILVCVKKHKSGKNK